jgi:RNA polymerase sigma-70 factor (sigma-E family)
VIRNRKGRDFREFVVTSGPGLLRLARALASDPSAAEDLAQTTLLRAWRSWSRVQAADDVDAYVRRIMVNVATSGWRRRWRIESPTDAITPPQRCDGYQRVDDHDQLIRALRELPARYRTAVVLRYFVDLDDAAIADALECSVSTVRSLISRALSRLRVAETASVPPLARFDCEQKEQL